MTNINFTIPEDILLKTIQGKICSFKSFKEQKLLIVNVASYCGFTKQYQELENLYQEFKTKSFSILAFPCNQFLSQEPGNSKEILNFCKLNYNISFPIFEKIEVNGKNTHPLYVWLKTAKPGIFGTKCIKWNFTKFLIDKNKQEIKRYAPWTSIKRIRKDIKAC